MMKINMDKIPKGKTFKDYPKDTKFVLNEERNRKVNPKTGLIIKNDF